MYNEGVVGVQNVQDSLTTKARFTKEGATLDTNLHGKYYEAASRGQVFYASTVIAGKVVVVAAATLAATFTVQNPAGSGKNLELITFHWGPTSATTVVNTIGLLKQSNLSTGAGIPTGLTSGSIHALGVGGTSVANFYSIATLTNVAIPGAVGSAVPIPFYIMMSNAATTDTAGHEMVHYFDGRLIVQPDALVSVCTNITSATIATMGLCWAEYPV